MFHLMIMLAAFILTLMGCVPVPYIDSGFVIRSDLRTTDCAGNSSPDDINATPSDKDPFNFLNLQDPPLAPPTGQPDERVRVKDCINADAKVLRAAGLKLQRGDVLYLGTGAVGPSYDSNGRPIQLHLPAALAAPVRLTLRTVEPSSGRLYAEEDQFLAAAFSMVGRSGNQIQEAKGENLARVLDRRQAVLWNTLLDNLRLWRKPVPAATNPVSGRPALTLRVDYVNWCNDLKERLVGEKNAATDIDELTKYFSGSPGECQGKGDNDKSAEFSRITAPARSALQAVAIAPKPAGAYYSQDNALALYTQLAVDLKGARFGAAEAASTVGAWTLADWQHAQICKDKEGKDLTIVAFRMRDGKEVHVKTNKDELPTVVVRLVFTQTLQARQFIETETPWWRRWKLMIDSADLDKLYARELNSIEWSAEPSDPSMCLI